MRGPASIRSTRVHPAPTLACLFCLQPPNALRDLHFVTVAESPVVRIVIRHSFGRRRFAVMRFYTFGTRRRMRQVQHGAGASDAAAERHHLRRPANIAAHAMLHHLLVKPARAMPKLAARQAKLTRS